MRTYLSILICLVITALAARAQPFVSIEGTFNTFLMSDMKQVQKEATLGFPVPLPVVTSFPPYAGVNALVGIQSNENLAYGVGFQFMSTGGRAYYEDYSGMARFDQLATSYGAGAFFRLKANKSQQWPLLVGLHATLLFSSMTLTSEFRLGSQSQVSKLDLTSLNIAIRPMLGVQRNLGDRWFATAFIGYEVNVPGHLFTESGAESSLTLQWDGFRASMGVGHRIGSGSNSKKNR